MKNMQSNGGLIRRSSILIMFFFMITEISAQVTGDMIKYSPDFSFSEGFYINFEQVRNNVPVPAARVVTEEDHTNPDFFNKVLDGKKFAFFDPQGVRREVDVNQMWGFSRNGVIYIRVGEVFNRITFIGNICHFVATVTTYNSRYYDPYYYNPYSPYRYMYSPSNYSSSEMRQYIMDFETGKVLEYNERNLEVLLMKDPELHDEYTALRKKKQKQLKFMYIRKFNERNPLYLPR
jgi:hypothetical protein